ncbi:peptidoglycan-binding protein [Dactylosporangium sp. CA-092794]|uniref:peptidoglycan-binding protein n=1 Tax=Dactylosporangium sp. CA-092794 TaxID=3239929 RepID=UPI003D8ED9BF
MRRLWPLPAAALLVAAAAVALLHHRPAGPPPAQGPRPAASAAVVRTDLTDTHEYDGSIGYGPERPLPGKLTGTITWLPAPGTRIGRGERLYAVDARPVVLFVGATPLYRTLDKPGLDGPDVQVLEENLTALGLRPGRLPDEHLTPETITAVKQWQRALGVPETGIVTAGDVVVQPAPVRVATVQTQVGAAAGDTVMTVTGTETVVTVPMAAAEAHGVPAGAKVQVVLSGGATAGGSVREVGPPVADPAGGKSTAAVVVALDGPPPDGLAGPDVRVRFAGRHREGVLAVPVGALVALREGGYAVQLTGGPLVPVQLGMFDRGLVEVSGPGLREGLSVVVAS